MRPRHTLTVQPRGTVRGELNQNELRDVGPAVTVRCNVHPLTAEEIQLYGDRALETRKVFFYGRVWPGDMNCRITFDGATWDQVAPAEQYNLGRRTRHFTIVIRKR